MKKETVKYFFGIAWFFIGVCFASAQVKPWAAPQGWSAKKNPIVSSNISIKAGKNTYRTFCIICHGETGKGNGSLALSFKPLPADHTGKKFQLQKDGEIFYKITTGRNAMPPFKPALSENDIWNVIHFVRTLAVKDKPAPPKSITTATATLPSSNQKKNISDDTTSANKTNLTVKSIDTMVVHTDSIAAIKNMQPINTDTTSKNTVANEDTLSAFLPIVPSSDSINQNNQNDVSKEERRKVLLTGSANINVNVDGKKFNSAGIAIGFLPLIVWQPSKNLLFESHFHISAVSGIPQSNTSSGSMAGMIMRTSNPPSVQGGTHGGSSSSSSTTSTTTAASASIMLAYADLVYFINPYMTLTGGIFLSPFGLYPERMHAPWMNRLPDAPAGMGNEQVLPETELGMQLRGGIPIGKTKAVYALYFSNGPSLVDDTSKYAGKLSYDNLTDNNNNKAIGGRLGFLPIPNNASLEIGFFAQRARIGKDATPHAGVQAMLYGADVMYHQYFRFLKGTIDMKGQHCKVSTDRVYYKANPLEIVNVPAEDVNLNDSTYRFNNITELYFVMVSYRPTASEHFLKNTEYIFRYDYLKEPTFSRWNISGSRFTMGIEYWLDSRSAFKLAYQVGIPENMFLKNQNILMFQWVIGF